MSSVYSSLATAHAPAALPHASYGRRILNHAECILPSYYSKTGLLHRASPASTYHPSSTSPALTSIRCCPTSAAAPKPKVVQAPPTTLHQYDEETVHLELSITKDPTYIWPPQHKLVLRLVSSTQVDPGTGKGIVSHPTLVFIPPGEATVKLHVDMQIPRGFGMPAALLLDSLHTEEFFLDSVSWNTPMSASDFHYFWCNSWVTQTSASQPRIFFTNDVFLPNQTPSGLTQLRQTELDNLRGDGTGRRHLGERIYDYDVYNDLGNPDMNPETGRPVLGGSQGLPYPRRCRTGRERTATDPMSEAPELDAPMFYVPRDEQFSPSKQLIMDRTVDQSKLAVAMHLKANLESVVARNAQHIPAFDSFEEIFRLYDDGLFPRPPVILQDKDAWWTDEEYARQRLAGLNPIMIERVKEFPLVSSLDPQIYGPPTSAITAQHIEHNLEGLTVKQAVSHKRIFSLDYHDALLPVLEQVNLSADVYVYATRTLFFLTNKGILKPVAIELSSPPTKDNKGHLNTQKRVFTPPAHGIEDFPGEDKSAWLWHLAKAHTVVNDTGYHQLISHWLRTHATMEPFVIATHRQLSALHPVHRLLLPHLKDTLSINGQARKSLINGGGVIESSFFPRSLSIQFSSLVYKNWRFDEQGLPQDLIKRGMAEKNQDNGLTLTIQDYPYAVDGLELWTVLQSWVRDYLDIYYQNDNAVKDDTEIQKWWNEIKDIGHGDHREAKWWGAMNTKHELEQALLTIIWVASGHHAAVNFGQYAYAGFMPNSPSMGKRSVPDTSGGNDQDLQELTKDPERFFLSSLATQEEALAVMGTVLLLSQHIEEEFLGEVTHLHWTSDPRVKSALGKFSRALKQVEANIDARNQNSDLYKNRHGPAQMPYKLLFPSSGQGLTFQGVPNSVAI